MKQHKGDQRPVDLVIFVPGFMGSALRYKGRGPLGNTTDIPLWGEQIVDSLEHRKLELLVYPTQGGTVEAHGILEQRIFKYRWFPRNEKEMYRSLLGCLNGLVFSEKCEFLPFPYDWRESITISARKLEQKAVQSRSWANMRSVMLVGHSMGGLICRLALASSDEFRKRVSFLVQIATPLRGSIKAFYTLMVWPVLHSSNDYLFRLLMKGWDLGYSIRGDPGLCDLLMRAVRSFPSVYELLPPPQEKPLVTMEGDHLSCFYEKLWPPNDRSLLTAARRVKGQLRQNLDTPTLVVYSVAHDTPVMYQIPSGSSYAFNVTKVEQMARGDGTVTEHSAMAGLTEPVFFCEQHAPNEHVSICCNPNVLRLIETVVRLAPLF